MTSVNEKEQLIEIENEEGITSEQKYDTLVICTGAEYSGGIWRGDDPEAVQKRDRINKAKSVLVVGGGMTGIEACGYLAEFQVPKGVMIGLCHRSGELLS